MPGAFPMQDNSDTTLLKALALSQGTMPYSQKLAYIYRKDPVTNKRTEIPVELQQIMARKSPDVLVYPDDIIYIPENHGKKLATCALDRIAGTGQSVASALAVPLLVDEGFLDDTGTTRPPIAESQRAGAHPALHSVARRPILTCSPATAAEPLLWILKRSKWKILGFVAFCMVSPGSCAPGSRRSMKPPHG